MEIILMNAEMKGISEIMAVKVGDRPSINATYNITNRAAL